MRILYSYFLCNFISVPLRICNVRNKTCSKQMLFESKIRCRILTTNFPRITKWKCFIRILQEAILLWKVHWANPSTDFLWISFTKREGPGKVYVSWNILLKTKGKLIIQMLERLQEIRKNAYLQLQWPEFVQHILFCFLQISVRIDSFKQFLQSTKSKMMKVIIFHKECLKATRVLESDSFILSRISHSKIIPFLYPMLNTVT